MKTSIYKLLLLFAVNFPLCSFAETPNINNNIERQVKIIDFIKPFVERVDQARLMVIRKSLNSILEDISTNASAGRNSVTFQTIRLIQNLIIQYKYSQSFFGWSQPIAETSIYTEATASYLDELHNLSTQVEKEFGLDDSPYTQITASTFRQIQKLLLQLESLAIDASLKSQLRSLWPSVGEAIAIAEQGDRPLAFKSATTVIANLRNLYPYFDQISATSAGFSMILEIQGLSEFYSEFAQMDK